MVSIVKMIYFDLCNVTVVLLNGVNIFFFLQVALVAISTAMTATEEITATLVAWIGGATSHQWNRLPCQTSGNHMLT